jgi:uroporphyrinogen-III synthase
VLLYSRRSAKLWTELVVQSDRKGEAGSLRHFCLSPNVAAVLPASWPRKVAKKPLESEMLALLDPVPRTR